MIINCATLRGYLQGISGLFITKDNPGGFTPKELDILTAIVLLLQERNETVVSAEIKRHIAELTNHPVQVITNYVKKLRDKRALTTDNKLNPVIKHQQGEITIRYAKTEKKQSNV